ncbi:hypothetical protein V8G54_030310 [Vigna mungo]|uniref:Uncharacterized protein n=1 Tax=Vigna mungo TaxID=3915 RepID=A0AAQ3MWT7_VIGMU
MFVRREADPSGWINDDKTRERFLIMRSLTEVVKHHMAELIIFEQEKFTFPDDLKFQGLNKFIGMKGDCYNELIEVFYYNLDKEEKVIAFIIGHILLPRRYNIIKLTPTDVCLLYAIVFRIQTNWVAIFKEHILEVGTSEGHRLLYGVFISKVLEHYGVDFTNEKKQTCGRENLIGKATLTCIGMNRTSQGWDFRDENVVQNKRMSHGNNVSDEEVEILNSEFEIRVNDRFKRASKRINTFNNSLA